MEGVKRIWREAKPRGAGRKREKILAWAAEHSIGSKEAPEAARIELRNLLKDMDVSVSRVEELLGMIEENLKEIPCIEIGWQLRGGLITVSGLIAEAGDKRRFDDPKQLQKLAEYANVANNSGKRKGQRWISYREQKYLRYVLYEMGLSLFGKNAEFKKLHEYYRTRKENPVRGIQL